MSEAGEDEGRARRSDAAKRGHARRKLLAEERDALFSRARRHADRGRFVQATVGERFAVVERSTGATIVSVEGPRKFGTVTLGVRDLWLLARALRQRFETW